MGLHCLLPEIVLAVEGVSGYDRHIIRCYGVQDIVATELSKLI